MVTARFDSYPAVVGYEVLNEPYGANSHTGTQDVLSFEARIRSSITAVDPTRAVFVMTRYGGDKGLVDATFKAFGSLAHLVLDYHDYYSGVPGTGMTFDDENWAPDWAATHLHTITDYQGTLAARAGHARLPAAQVVCWGPGTIPVLMREWGVRRDDQNGAACQAQMLSIMDREGLSWARWSCPAAISSGCWIRTASRTPTTTSCRPRWARLRRHRHWGRLRPGWRCRRPR